MSSRAEGVAEELRQVRVMSLVVEDDDQGPFLSREDAENMARAAEEWMELRELVAAERGRE